MQATLVEVDAYVCSTCGAPVAADATVCPRCGADVSEIEPAAPGQAQALLQRYEQPYIAAQRQVVLGDVVRIGGYVLAGLLVLLAFLGLAGETGPAGLTQFLIQVLVAIVVGVLLHAWGASLSASGHRLMATLDIAVNGSPFLTDEQRAEIMGL